MLEIVTAKLVEAKNAIFDGVKVVLGKYTNILGKANNIDYIATYHNYGQGSIPLANLMGLVTPIIGSSKTLACLGFVMETPPNSNAYAYQVGESWINSANYVLVMQNNGIIAYRTTLSPEFHATLLNGEFVNQILLNILNDNNNVLRNYINDTIVQIYNNHTHGGVARGGDSTGAPSTPMTDITPNDTLIHDKNCINAGNDLINDNGKLYSQT